MLRGSDDGSRKLTKSQLWDRGDLAGACIHRLRGLLILPNFFFLYSTVQKNLSAVGDCRELGVISIKHLQKQKDKMAEPKSKKRELEGTAISKGAKPSRRPKKKQRTDHDEPRDGEGQDFQAVNLGDSDSEHLDDAEVDDGQWSSFSDEDDDEYSDFGSSDDEEGGGRRDTDGARAKRKAKSKRNDPDAFATSISKILNTKLSTSRRADPVLARSAEAQEASRKAVDSSLDAKARKQLRDQKRLALEKGRVRDVLVASNAAEMDPATGEAADGQTTAQILETEKRLRKVAQRGVVKLFNAVRAAQVKASEAERAARAEGVVGMGRRQEKITEMTRQGFLDLLASGGGGLKKGPLEEG